MEGMHRFSSNYLKLVKLILLCSLLLAFSGCASLISGYNSEFQCPETNKGKCVSVKTAYKESLEGSTEDNPLVKQKNKQKDAHCAECEKDSNRNSPKPEARGLSRPEPDAEYSYRHTLYKKLSSMIGKPITPLVVPPEVVRVLILSYTGSNNELFSYRYVYFFATEPRWVISTAKEVE